MRVLLDTHAFLWWLAGDPKLSAQAKKAVGEDADDVVVSAASAWEIATKVRLGKLPGAVSIVDRLPETIGSQGFACLSVTVEHGRRAGLLPGPLRDPFDRMLVAQAVLEDLALISNERPFDRYGIRRLW